MTNTVPANNLSIYPISEKAVTIEFGHVIDESLMDRISRFNWLLNQNPFPGLLSTVPAYSTLSIFFDPVKVIQNHTLPGKSCLAKVSGYLNSLKEDESPSSIAEEPVIAIPVCYGGAFGPDLEYVADYHKLSMGEVISIHSSAVYKVYMIGFIPGFAYLGGLSALLETPRKDNPRKAVPAGAVGIAGKQTGVYPLETPGGWQLIGQTPVKLFDAQRLQPSLLKAGDSIKFEPISLPDFETYRHH